MDDHFGAGPGESEGCPPWCRRVHSERDHPEDRLHQSRAALVATITGHPAVDPDQGALAVSVVARLVRRTGSELTWVEILGEETRAVRLVVTVESARRLLRAVEGLLAEATS